MIDVYHMVLDGASVWLCESSWCVGVRWSALKCVGMRWSVLECFGVCGCVIEVYSTGAVVVRG